MEKDNTIICYDAHARAYDAYQFHVVPGYQAMLDLVAEAARRYLPANSKIIDLGCGTGNASLAVLKKVPVTIFLIDGSERMVDVATQKITLSHPGAILGKRVADLSEDDWAEGLDDGKFDAIFSTLVLEHLPFDRYRAVLGKCFQLLKPGGWLLAAEGYAEEGSDMQEWFFLEMDIRQKAFAAEFSNFVAGLRNEKEIHYYTSKEEKAEWWRKAGFGQVNVLWQYLCIALMAGRKPPKLNSPIEKTVS